MRKIILDGNYIYNIQDVHTFLAIELNFPEYYGHNLDALWDCLTEIGEPVLISWINSKISEQRLGINFYKLVNLFQEAAKSEKSNLRGQFLFELS